MQQYNVSRMQEEEEEEGTFIGSFQWSTVKNSFIRPPQKTRSSNVILS